MTHPTYSGQFPATKVLIFLPTFPEFPNRANDLQNNYKNNDYTLL
ncbi:hypothetical protein MPF_0315 [Methanohalophilus portucalensis FDF-1]|uniref:Uncharacterized protein n=1 Tax=Methanohalophilus portucalensis FDF-1 TaxID=523843 RepID=A0A1L9C4U8_9EURY|nr:hypothetical protein MPF_0315 [Methanohalophilus portucalensis FDF-1]